MLAEVYEELIRAPQTSLVAARNVLPDAPFKLIKVLQNGTLEARDGLYSKFEFRLTLKDVQPGKTQEKLEALVAEMNTQFSAMDNCPLCGFKVFLSRNGDLPNYTEANNLVFTCSSLIDDSTNRARNFTTTGNDGMRISHEALLSAHELVQVPNDVVRAVAGMFRVARGFPLNQNDIGTESDDGDVFEGKVARTKGWGSSSPFAASYPHGVTAEDWLLNDFPNRHVGVVGGLSCYTKSDANVSARN